MTTDTIAIAVRTARVSDIPDITALINGYAAERVMLPRSIESVRLALEDFVVATDEWERVVACGSLKTYSPSLGEVASLAVAREAHGRGLGRMIVAHVEALARVRGIGELFALTLTPAFFEAVGYGVTDRAKYPEKIRGDCATCARRFACAEVCVSRVLGDLTLEAAA